MGTPIASMLLAQAAPGGQTGPSEDDIARIKQEYERQRMANLAVAQQAYPNAIPEANPYVQQVSDQVSAGQAAPALGWLANMLFKTAQSTPPPQAQAVPTPAPVGSVADQPADLADELARRQRILSGQQ